MAKKKYCLKGAICNFDYHGVWGDYCSPRSVREFLDGLNDGEEAEIEINSPGGLVVCGIEIANAIKNCKAKLVAHVTGIAASMALVIACACDEIVMEEASFMMIHDPWGYAEGNADEMRKEAGVLDQMKAVCMAFYRGKFNRTEEEIAALMSDETWYTGNECMQNGLKCTVVKSDVRAAASIVGHHFAKMPEAAAKFLATKEVTPEGQAEIDAAKAEAARLDEADAAAAAAAAQGAAGTGAESSTGNKSALLDAYLADPSAERSPEDYRAILAELDKEGFGARYRGASKKINELQAELDANKAKGAEALAAINDELGKAVAARDEASKTLDNFKDQVKNAGFEDLAALIGAVSGLKTDLEKSGQDLAACREQLDQMKNTRDLLTGSVLTPQGKSTKYADFAQAVDALGYAEAAKQYPELKKSYRAKKVTK
mgnify:CR=1 FL=1